MLFLIVVARMTEMALSTETMIALVYIGIFCIVGMSRWTMGAILFVFPRLAATCIYQVSDRFQMIRVDAASNAAEMIQFQPFWNRTFEPFVREAVGAVHLSRSTAHAEQPVPVSSSCCPKPASAVRLWRDFTHKAVDLSYTEFSHVPSFKAHRSGLRSTGMLSRPVSHDIKVAS